MFVMGHQLPVKTNDCCRTYFLLIQFRTAIDDVLSPEFDDYYLLRWLRARHFDVVAAELMLRRVSYQISKSGN